MLIQATEKYFTQKLVDWYETYKYFLDEKSVSSPTEELNYTHPKIRVAYRSLRAILSYLFTYIKYKLRFLF